MTEVSRRVLILGGIAVTVVPGMGGTPDKPPGYMPPDQPGVAAGSPNIIRARQVIIVGTGGELLIYSPSAGAGNLIVAGAGSSSTDQYGNTFFQGVQSINGQLVALLESGALFLQAATGQISGGFAGELSAVIGNPGEVFLSSGGASAIDGTSQLDLRSATAGGGTSQATLNAQTVTINNNFVVNGTITHAGSTSTGAGDNGGVTSGPSGTVNAFPAAGPNHTHAETHHHPL